MNTQDRYTLESGSVWRITPFAVPGEEFVRLAITYLNSQLEIILPAYSGIDFRLVIGDQPVTLTFFSTRLTFARVPLPRSGFWLSRVARRFSKNRAIIDERFAVVATGKRSVRRQFYNFMRMLRRSGMHPESGALGQCRDIILGWPSNDSKTRITVGDRIRVAFVVHLYYIDILDEIATRLALLDMPFDVLVTIPEERMESVEKIKSRIPRAQIFVLENRGRDVRPFLWLLELGHLENYDVVCKIHGKRSIDGERNPLAGHIWRRRLFADLFATPAAVEKILKLFAQNPRLGIVGPASYRYPSENLSEEQSWAGNKSMVCDLLSRMGLSARNPALDFFAGTMFWVRPSALSRLRSLQLVERNSFEAESGRVDGGLEHAVERIFSLAVQAEGFDVGEFDCLQDV